MAFLTLRQEYFLIFNCTDSKPEILYKYIQRPRVTANVILSCRDDCAALRPIPSVVSPSVPFYPCVHIESQFSLNLVVVVTSYVRGDIFCWYYYSYTILYQAASSIVDYRIELKRVKWNFTFCSTSFKCSHMEKEGSIRAMTTTTQHTSISNRNTVSFF